MRWSKWGGLALAVWVAAGLTGCQDSDDTTVSSSNVGAAPIARIRGRVVDRETRAPLPATVTVCGFAVGSTDGNGEFVIDVVGAIERDSESSQTITVKFDVPGFATAARTISVDTDDTGRGGGGEIDPNANDLRVFTVGTVELGPQRQLTVVVTKDGDPLANAAVVALLESSSNGYGVSQTFAYDGRNGSEPCLPEILGRTGQDGTVVLNGFDENATYDILVPAQDLDGNMVIDFNSESEGHRIRTEGSVVAINVTTFLGFPEVDRDGDNLRPFPIAQNFAFSFFTGPITNDASTLGLFGNRDVGDYQNEGLNVRQVAADEQVSFSQFIGTSDGSVRVVFANPVTIITTGSGTVGLEPHFEYRNNLRNPATAPAFGPQMLANIVAIPATAAPLANTLNTVWTFTPSSALPANEVVTLRYFVQATGGAGTSVTNDSIGNLYRPVLGNNSLTALLDNYNGAQDGSTIAGSVYLEFDEVVEGSYKLLQMTNGTTVTPFAEVTRPIGTGNTTERTQDSMVFNVVTAPATGRTIGDTGVTAGIRYRVRLVDPNSNPIILNDNTTQVPTSVTLVISVRDAEGVRRDEILTLPVR